MIHPSPTAAAFAGLVDLASADSGGAAVACSDDSFASMDHLVRASPPVFDPHAFTDHGRLMDGWQGRRRNGRGHDWCIIKLGVAGTVHGVDIDTSHFHGDAAPFASIEGANVPLNAESEALRSETEWTQIVAPFALQPNGQNLQSARTVSVWTHVRIRVFPDGGVARLRVWGEPASVADPNTEVDLACAQHGGQAMACSSTALGSPVNLLKRQPAIDIRDGWEPQRNRRLNGEWVVIRLGGPARIAEVVLDTKHFSGNHPERIRVDGIHWVAPPLPALLASSAWKPIVESFEPAPDAPHLKSVNDAGPWTHVRVHVGPDGGISRVRVYGSIDRESPSDPKLVAINAMTLAEAAGWFQAATGCPRWAQRMADCRPFTSRTQLCGLAEWNWWLMDESDWVAAMEADPGATGETVRRSAAQHIECTVMKLAADGLD